MHLLRFNHSEMCSVQGECRHAPFIKSTDPSTSAISWRRVIICKYHSYAVETSGYAKVIHRLQKSLYLLKVLHRLKITLLHVFNTKYSILIKIVIYVLKAQRSFYDPT